MDDARLGSVIADRYRLDVVVGGGSMGTIYQGTHMWTGRKLAVKVLKPQAAQSEIALQRFFQEARAAAGLNHPNVVDVLDLGLDAHGDAYIVLELLEGESLEARLKQVDRLTPADTLDILLPVLDALALAHDNAIIHRDIKPANIVLSHDARGRLIPKLLDFGIAKLIEQAPTQHTPKTKPGAMLGTIRYMAPDFVLNKEAVGPQVDVWSMGVVLYQCLSGSLPYYGETSTATLVMIASMSHKNLGEQAPDLPKELVDAVEGALVKEREGRYKTIEELTQALMDAANAHGIPISMASRVATSASLIAPARAVSDPGAVDVDPTLED